MLPNSTKHHTWSNQANFGCLPYEILEKIFQFLPLSDKINSGFLCANWHGIVGCNIKHVTINASMPCGGRWTEENLRWITGNRGEERDRDRYYHEKESQDMNVWFRDENDPADKKMKKLIAKLCKLTNKIRAGIHPNLHVRYNLGGAPLSRKRPLVHTSKI